MQVIDKPKTGGDGQPENGPDLNPAPRKKGLIYGGRETRVGFFAGRFAFVVVTAMFLIMVLFSGFMLYVSLNSDYLQPFVPNDALYQDKIYLQVDGESTYRELILVDQPGDYDQHEITHLPVGKGFKVIFTPKQLEVPEHYYITFLNGPNMNHEIEGGYTRQARYIKEDKFYSLTVSSVSGTWPEGQYVIDAPSGGMFGGRFYAYFTVGDPVK